jgi:uncharacterized membrane protein
MPKGIMSDLLKTPLPSVLIAAVVTLFVGYLTKQVCFAIGLGDSFYCWSDYGGLYVGRELAAGRFPYFPPALEYPAGLGLIVWLTSAVTTSALGFVRMTMAMLAIAGLITAWILWRDTGRRALLFAAAPTLALYAFLNWDLAALVFGVASISAFLRRRDVPAGLLLGIGAAIKIFPALLLVPMAVERWREGHRDAALRLALAAAAAVLVLNVPVAWASLDGWSHFLQFSSVRPVDWGTLWSVGCQTSGSGLCNNVPVINALSPALFLAASIATWLLVTRAAPAIPRWQLAFPLIVIFFLTNKVYSPQYSLWILPWFALVLPNLGLFLAYEAVDLGIYVTTFAWQQHLTGAGGLPLWPLNFFIVLRAAVLIAMIVALTRQATVRHA